jgi:hypothetical protein
MNININYDKDGNIVSYQGGDISGNECPEGCETLSVDDALVKFDPMTMKVVNGQLAKKG